MTTTPSRAAVRHLAAVLAEHSAGFRRDGRLDVPRLERLTAELEALVGEASLEEGGGLHPAERILILDEADRLRADLQHQLAALREVVDEERRRRLAASLYLRRGR